MITWISLSMVGFTSPGGPGGGGGGQASPIPSPQQQHQQQQQQQQQQVFEVRGQAVTTQDYANLLQWVRKRTLDSGSRSGTSSDRAKVRILRNLFNVCSQNSPEKAVLDHRPPCKRATCRAFNQKCISSIVKDNGAAAQTLLAHCICSSRVQLFQGVWQF